MGGFGTFLGAAAGAVGEGLSEQRKRLLETAMLSKRLEIENKAKSIPQDQFESALGAMGAPTGAGRGITHPVAQSGMLDRFERSQQASRMTTDPKISALIEQTHGFAPGSLTGVKSGELPFVIPSTAYNAITGETMTLQPRGKVVTPPGAADAQKAIGKMDMFNSALDDLETALKDVDPGRIQGNLDNYINKFSGMYPEVAQARGLQDVMMPMVARLIGGDVGNLSETEQKRAYNLIPKMSGTEEERRLAFAELRSLAKIAIERNRANVSGMFKRPEMVPASAPKTTTKLGDTVTMPKANGGLTPAKKFKLISVD